MDIRTERLKKAFADSGLNQTEVCEKTGINKGALSSYLSGRYFPKQKTLVKLSELFNVPIKYLMGLDSMNASLNNKNEVKAIKIPVIGLVHAGIPTEAVEEIIDWEEITPELASKGDIMALKIKGDCMEPKFSEGDVVIVLCQSDCNSGDIAIIMVNGDEAEMKKIRKFEDGSINLIATNPAYPVRSYSPKEIESLPLRVLGKVIELRAKF